MLDCSGPCAAGKTLVASRDVPGAPANADGAIFNDHYSFSLTGPVDASGNGFAIDLIPGYNIEDLTFELFGPSMASLGSFAVPNGTGGTFFTPVSFLDLASGAYTLLVSGVIPETYDGGLYLFETAFTDASVSQVPLPPAIFLFLSALVGMFSLSQMRKRSPTTGASSA